MLPNFGAHVRLPVAHSRSRMRTRAGSLQSLGCRCELVYPRLSLRRRVRIDCRHHPVRHRVRRWRAAVSVQLNFDLLDRSLAAFRACPPVRDALTEGASVFFEVAYADVTREQRQTWKVLTFGARSQPCQLT